MGLLSKTFDRLPRWANITWGVLAVLGCAYLIYREGFFIFLLKLIFTPTF